MKQTFILDTGPLVALFDRGDFFHTWAIEHWARAKSPFLTCESVLSEAGFLLRGFPQGPQAVLEAVHRGIIEIPFRLAEHVPRVKQLMAKYAGVPMSLADACLVCMAEQHSESTVFTLDHDFRIYRKHGRTAIPVLMPDE